MWNVYIKVFGFALLLSWFLVSLIIKVSRKYQLFDKVDDSKIHTGQVSRLGGVAMLLAFVVAVFGLGGLEMDLPKIGLLCGLCLILIVGLWDDLCNISWKKQLLCQIFLALGLVQSGLLVDYIVSPFGGTEFRLDIWWWHGWSVLGTLFVVVWLVGFMNVVNWLDGLDGMAAGVSLIAMWVLFLLSVSDLVNQPSLAILAVGGMGSILGFLKFNFVPAKIFMGTVGSWFLGFILAVLAILSGGKMATLVLVFSVPIFDAFYVILKRIRSGQSCFQRDQNHFYHNLLHLGWSSKKIIFVTYIVCGVLGFLALLLNSKQKFIVCVVWFMVFFILIKKLKFRS